eukprot:CAMPEP_0194079800 /NCGR_PEP_ID=MMETSP0149-20130528/5941_1 /TAXON_ID=122233 /ORGANISM="Chaetoceros debilis, Strain MM31A-1" /LENGTH=208 /DNA_ID=CAMNT_0038761381 /DNA_START=61 /DNA_END=687 /DNA_ORIENTATION=-
MVCSLKFIGAMLTFVAAGTGTGTTQTSVSVSAFTPLLVQVPMNTQRHTFSGPSTDPDPVRSRPVTALSATLTHTHDSHTFVRDDLLMMPATLEKEKVNVGGAPAVLDRPVVDKKQAKSPSKERKSTGSEAWEVRIYNDGRNTREFVARCLVQIVGVSELKAYQTMMQAHQNGIAVVGVFVYEVAEMYHGELKKNGIVCDLVPVEEEKN